MNAPHPIGAFAHKLPPAQPTLLQLALAVVVAKQAQREHFKVPEPWSEMDCARQDRLDDLFADAEAAFFNALADETGIDSELFAKLGDAL